MAAHSRQASPVRRKAQAPGVLQRIWMGLPRLLFLFFILALVACWWYLLNPRFFPVQAVRVEASYNHVNAQALRQVIEPYTEGNFFTVDVARLRQALLQIPWVADADVKRVWPGQLVVKITEQQPVARWDNTGLINAEGQFFPAQLTGTALPRLPQLVGPGDQQSLVWQNYQQLQALLTPLKLQIQTLALNERHSWSATLSNGIQVELGRIDVLARWQRFLDLYPKLLVGHSTLPKSVDLRYSDGLAVDWGSLAGQ